MAQGAAAVVCYNLQLIKDEGWYNFTTEAAVNRTWDYYQCSLAIACAYAPRPPPGSPPSASSTYTIKQCLPLTCPIALISRSVQEADVVSGYPTGKRGM